MDIPIAEAIKNDHFVKSVQFDLHESTIQDYFKSLCSTCESKQKIHAYDPIQNAIFISHKYPRSEVASYRLLKETDMRLSWKVRLNKEADDVNATISQLIGWQPNCFTRGNYHLRSFNGSWQVWMRNIDENERDIILNKSIKYDEWVEMSVYAKFSEFDGYITLSIKDSESLQVFDLVKNGPTYIACDMGPYMKFGSYTHHASTLEVGLKDILVNYR